MDEIWSVLENVSYPATKTQLVEHATAAGARPDQVERLEALSAESYADEDQLGRSLARTRAGSNPGLVAITPEPCEQCGFPRMPGEPHSCVEEKARFAETVQTITDEFETFDDGSAA